MQSLIEYRTRSLTRENGTLKSSKLPEETLRSLFNGNQKELDMDISFLHMFEDLLSDSSSYSIKYPRSVYAEYRFTVRRILNTDLQRFWQQGIFNMHCVRNRAINTTTFTFLGTEPFMCRLYKLYWKYRAHIIVIILNLYNWMLSEWLQWCCHLGQVKKDVKVKCVGIF